MESWLPAFAARFEAGLPAEPDKDDVQRLKHRVAKAMGAPRIPQDPELIPALSDEGRRRYGHILRKKPMRSQSGVAIVAVMSSPAACPHGKCIYCPGGPDVDAPQSYTGFEPSTMRAKRHGYESYAIVRARLEQLQRNGHATDKVEIVVQGGTFPAREPAYQDWFIAGIYAACNDGPGEGHWEPEDTWLGLDIAARSNRLEALQRANEAADCRVIGLTIETKPDWCLESHIDAMLRHGATRIELGIQTLDEEVTRLTNRGHSVQDAADAMRIARDAGFKVCVHMMPGLPRPQASASPEQVDGVGLRAGGFGGSQASARPAPVGPADRSEEAAVPTISVTEGGGADARQGATDKPAFAIDPAADLEDMRRLFAEPAWRPDMLKIYPTLIVQEGETTLKRWWQQGRFTAMDTEAAVDVVAESLRHVPEYCRIQRIDRDIPTTHVLAGVMNSNLRQLAEAEAEKRGIRLRDIRAREIGTRLRQGLDVSGEPTLVEREYDASGGQEVFLSWELPAADAVAGFLRLRRAGHSHRSEFQHPSGVAVVRELKVYGVAQRLGEHDDPEEGVWQHQGLGARLLAAAEDTARAWGVGRILVIAGPGVKPYYRRHGYIDLGPYVAKELQ